MRILWAMVWVMCSFFAYAADTTEEKNAKLAAAKTLEFASYERFNYTNSDNTGLYWDILKKVYEPMGYSIHIKYMPYKLAILALEKGQVDGIIGYPRYSKRDFVAPKYPVDINTLVMAYDPFSKNDFKDMESLNGKTILLFSGYDFETFITVPFTRNSFNDMETGIKRLLQENADVLVDFETDIKIAMEGMFMSTKKLIFKPLLTYYTYVQFSKGAKGQELADMYDNQIKSMLKTPSLELVYRGWGSSAYDKIIKLDVTKETMESR